MHPPPDFPGDQHITRAFRYRIYPTAQQQAALTRTLDLCRQLYNGMLEERQGYYRKTGKNLSAYTQMASLVELKAVLPEYASVNAQVLQDVAMRLERSFKGFFRRIKAGQKPGYPRFQGFRRYASFKYPQPNKNTVSSDGRHIYLPKIGNVRIRLHRVPDGHVRSLIVKREGTEWYVILHCDQPPPPVSPPTGSQVGIDVGITRFLTTSDGAFCANPRVFQTSQNKLRVAQRAVARKKRGSRRHAKARSRVARIHRTIARQRAQFHHEQAGALIRAHDLICHEDLKVARMTGDGLGKQIHDVGWTQFFKILSDKAAWAGRRVVAVDPRYTSQRCHRCDHTDRANRPDQATFRCQGCGHTAHADVNAAQNILAQGLRLEAERTSQEAACPEKLGPSGA